MKILITGARGNFPTALVASLRLMDHELVLLDIEPLAAPDKATSVQADIRDAAALSWAMRGCEVVVHAAACHMTAAGIRNYNDFYEVNVTGTHNVLRAMQLNGVTNLVFSSADLVYGHGMRGLRVMDESVPCVPTNIYGMTKLLGEEMCDFYARTHNMRIAVLRYGCFLPGDWKLAGMGRLGNWLDREDVAQANELAIAALLAEEFRCEPFLIESAKPFQDDDWPEAQTNPDRVLERYFPGSVELLTQHGLKVPRMLVRYDISKAQSLLGYDPQHNFAQFLARLRSTPA